MATARALLAGLFPSETPGPSEWTYLYEWRATPVPPTATPTATPTPTATARPTSNALPRGWPANHPDLTASKLSVHVIPKGDLAVMDFVRLAHPRVLKAVDGLGVLGEVKAESPGTLTIGRLTVADVVDWLPDSTDPALAAQWFIESNLAEYRLHPFVDYWEGWNEFVPVTPERWEWYAQFEAARACGMYAHGLRAAVGGFSLGTPEYTEMGLFLPALEAAHRCGGIFTLHEGLSPIIGCGVGADDPELWLPGAPEFPGKVMGYVTARYRYWYEGWLKPRGLGDLPLAISELAIGGIVADSPCNGPGGSAWKDFQEWWVEQGVGPTGPQAYLNVLAWYDRLVREDPYVLGVTVFTAGASGGGDFWYDYDIHEVLPLLGEYAVGQR